MRHQCDTTVCSSSSFSISSIRKGITVLKAITNSIQDACDRVTMVYLTSAGIVLFCTILPIPFSQFFLTCALLLFCVRGDDSVNRRVMTAIGVQVACLIVAALIAVAVAYKSGIRIPLIVEPSTMVHLKIFGNGVVSNDLFSRVMPIYAISLLFPLIALLYWKFPYSWEVEAA